ncbi:MAG: hypothetical protein ACFCUQ_19840 [Kiloniellales bacterium]
MAPREELKLVSDETQALFMLLLARGVDPLSLTALVSSAYADGGHYVLNEFQDRFAS